MDADIVETIVDEVKSQGAFDEFRRDSMADVDTKPAYQNLRQRVEKTVEKFLSEQKWTPMTNKLQLREKLRKYVQDSGYLDTGVERIVDQVVNPKMQTVFKAKIEEIAYKCLNIPKPPPAAPFVPPPPPFPDAPLHIDVLPFIDHDLEQISPDSDVLSDKCDEDDMFKKVKPPASENTKENSIDNDEESYVQAPVEPYEVKEKAVDESSMSQNYENHATTDNLEKVRPCEIAYKVEQDENSETEKESFASKQSEKDVNYALNLGLQESHSQLSQISSSSGLSMEVMEVDSQSHMQHVAAENISEEAQMPKFNENSNDDDVTKGRNNKLHFDIKQDELKFEGTHRPSNAADFKIDCVEVDSLDHSVEQKQAREGAENFKFANINVKANDEPTANESSCSFSLNNSNTHQLCIVETTQLSDSENKQAEMKVKDKEIGSLESGVSAAGDNSTTVIKKQTNDSEHKEHKISSHSSRSSSHYKKYKKDNKDRHHSKHKHKELSRDKESSRHTTKTDHRHKSSSASTTPSKKSSHSSSSRHKSHRHSSSGHKIHKETSLNKSNTQKSEQSSLSEHGTHKKWEAAIDERYRCPQETATNTQKSEQPSLLELGTHKKSEVVVEERYQSPQETETSTQKSEKSPLSELDTYKKSKPTTDERYRSPQETETRTENSEKSPLPELGTHKKSEAATQDHDRSSRMLESNPQKSEKSHSSELGSHNKSEVARDDRYRSPRKTEPYTQKSEKSPLSEFGIQKKSEAATDDRYRSPRKTEKSDKSSMPGEGTHKRSEAATEERNQSSRDKGARKKDRSGKRSKKPDDHYALKHKKHRKTSTDSNDDEKKPHQQRENGSCGHTEKTDSKPIETTTNDSGGSKSGTNSSFSPKDQAKLEEIVEEQQKNLGTTVAEKYQEQKQMEASAEQQYLDKYLTDAGIVGENESDPETLVNPECCAENTKSTTGTKTVEQKEHVEEDFLGFASDSEETCPIILRICLGIDEIQNSLRDVKSMVNEDQTCRLRRKRSADNADENQRKKSVEAGQSIKLLSVAENKAAMVSPTLSETSMNTKENECVPLDSAESSSTAKKKCVSSAAKRLSTLEKQRQQRYSSDDLYKPRPILGQTSRRRGLLDTIDAADHY